MESMGICGNILFKVENKLQRINLVKWNNIETEKFLSEKIHFLRFLNMQTEL